MIHCYDRAEILIIIDRALSPRSVHTKSSQEGAVTSFSTLHTVHNSNLAWQRIASYLRILWQRRRDCWGLSRPRWAATLCRNWTPPHVWCLPSDNYIFGNCFGKTASKQHSITGKIYSCYFNISLTCCKKKLHPQRCPWPKQNLQIHFKGAQFCDLGGRHVCTHRYSYSIIF